jgi:hypothetical protein
MAFNFGVFAADQNFEIQIFFVTSTQEEATLLAERFVNSAYRIAVTWVRADSNATLAITDAMSGRDAWLPTAIVLDFASYGQGLWNEFRKLRRAIGDRYVEYVVFDVPAEEIEQAGLRSANITMVPTESCFAAV